MTSLLDRTRAFADAGLKGVLENHDDALTDDRLQVMCPHVAL